MNELSKNLVNYESLLLEIKNNILNYSKENSIILHGNKGVGKATFAYKLIDEIYKHYHNENNSTYNQRLIYNNSHPNIRIIKKEYDDNSKNLKSNITINQIRILHDFVHQTTTNNLPKFIVIDSADDLNINSSNGLLKILEEPPKNTFFILIVNNLSFILPTIVSRCIKFKFHNHSINDFKKILLNFDNIQQEEILNLLFDLSYGSPGIAIKFFSEDMNTNLNDLFEIFKEKKFFSSKILNLSEQIGKYDNDQYRIFLSLLKFILLNTIKINLGINVKNQFYSKLLNSIQQVSLFINNTIAFEIINYLNENEKDLFIYNLDKKIFSLNIFNPLTSK